MLNRTDTSTAALKNMKSIDYSSLNDTTIISDLKLLKYNNFVMWHNMIY